MQVLTIGIDLGDRYSHYCVLGEDGEVLEEGRLSTTPEGFQQRFGCMVGCRIALEVGTHSAWVNELLQEAGHEVVVANPRSLRMIYQADSKHDRLDAQQLARVARMHPQLLSPIKHRSTRCRVDLAVLRARDGLVTARTRLINHGTPPCTGSQEADSSRVRMEARRKMLSVPRSPGQNPDQPC